jgi:2'-5' RNA ligase
LSRAQTALTSANSHVRSVGLSGLHLTLKFFGETPEDQLGSIRRAMKTAAATVEKPIHLIFSGVGVFPDAEKPRVIWAGLQGDVEALGRLAATLEQEMAKLGFPRESRPFHPHVTLGRMKFPKQLGSLAKAMQKLEARPFGEFDAEALVLFRSDLKPSGAQYTAIERISLL